jgi:hypothetical protein
LHFQLSGSLARTSADGPAATIAHDLVSPAFRVRTSGRLGVVDGED